MLYVCNPLGMHFVDDNLAIGKLQSLIIRIQHKLPLDLSSGSSALKSAPKHIPPTHMLTTCFVT